VLANLVDRADVGVVEAGDRARLVLETCDAAGALGGEELDDDLAPERQVFGAVDDRAAALAEFFADAVVGYGLSSHAPAHAVRSCSHYR
jgi:hypothetical protein